MDFLLSFFEILGLDGTFFIQLFLAAALYAVSARVFFRPYAEMAAKREELTRGRFKKIKILEEKTLVLQKQYEKKAREAYAAFQKDFLKIKALSEEEFKEKLALLLERHRKETAASLQKISSRQKEEMAAVRQDIPAMAKDLAEKLAPGPSKSGALP